ncbi:MAG: glycosyltransferase family 9 protein [Candidatus Binatia bacterium]
MKKRQEKFDPTLRSTIKIVFVLSRVTLGADVAITSIIMAKMKQAFPNSEVVLVGSSRMGQLFGGDPRTRVRDVLYERAGGLIERLDCWLDLIKVLNDEKSGFKPEEYLIVDPDSRLTQLGLLPLTEDDSRYYFFESRGYRKPGMGCISQLALSWLNERFGAEEELYPYVSLSKEDRDFAKRICQKLRSQGADYLVSINFGVGDNMRKRIHDPFEEQLVSNLVDDGNVVILDKGYGKEEINRANRLITNLRRKGKTVVEINENSPSDTRRPGSVHAKVIVWEGGIGLFSALIAETNEYIGYDSAGQHIAAALEVPTIDIFADSSHPLFFERWRPYGKGVVKVVKADTPSPRRERVDLYRVLNDVMTFHREIKKDCS